MAVPAGPPSSCKIDSDFSKGGWSTETTYDQPMPQVKSAYSYVHITQVMLHPQHYQFDAVNLSKAPVFFMQYTSEASCVCACAANQDCVAAWFFGAHGGMTQHDVLDTCLTRAGSGVRPSAAASRPCACQPVCLGGLHLLPTGPIVMSKTQIFPPTHLTPRRCFQAVAIPSRTQECPVTYICLPPNIAPGMYQYVRKSALPAGQTRCPFQAVVPIFPR